MFCIRKCNIRNIRFVRLSNCIAEFESSPELRLYVYSAKTVL
jgi:hypothetical protein